MTEISTIMFDMGDTSSLSTEVPLLQTGFYAGNLLNVRITDWEKKPTFRVDKNGKWDKNSNSWVETEGYRIVGAISFNAQLTSKRAEKILGRDQPIFFGNDISIFIDPETLKLSKTNVRFAQLLKVTGLTEVNWAEQVEWEYDEEIEVPDSLASVDNIVMMLNAVEYHKAYFSIIAMALEGVPAKVGIIKAANRKTKEQENRINITRTSVGLLAYTDGDEEDLDQLEG